jgi:2-dehydropantoate 2-reductase
VSGDIVILGGGAMGGAFGAALSVAGRPVAIVDPSSDVRNALSADGLQVSTPDGDLRAQVTAVAHPSELPPALVVLVFVKAAHTAGAADSLAPIIGPETVVATLQNGWGNADVLARRVPPERLVVGVTYHSATVDAPGRIRHTGRGPTFVGPYVDGGSLDPANHVAEVLRATAMEVTVTDAVKTEIWRKLVLNAATLPVSALTGLRAGQVGRPGAVRDLVDQLAAETTMVARLLGHDIDAAERIARIHEVLERAGEGKASMLQDVEARRLTEIETVNGAVARAAREAGSRAPLSEAMTALVHGLESSWERDS